MIPKLIYEYFKLNTISSYTKCESNAIKIINNELLLRDTLSNLAFKSKWHKKLNKSLHNNHFKFSIISIENSSNLYRVHVNRNRIFSFNNTSRRFHKSNNENFLFIISKDSRQYSIRNVAYKEENPIFYETLLNSSLENLSSLRNITDFVWTKNLNDINILYTDYVNLTKSLSVNILDYDLNNLKSNKNNSDYIKRKNMNTSKKHLYRLDSKSNSTLINCDKLIKYARKYALNYNKNYTQFNNSGGDCTNFVSQALNFADLNQSKTWKPYTASWIMVVPLRDYLIKNNIAVEYDEICQSPVGTIIQFFSPIKERFSHTGIITDMMDDGELLYSCHDYDKLDFPLSETYPVFYQRIRNLQIK